jgi:hypothetical protein
MAAQRNGNLGAASRLIRLGLSAELRNPAIRLLAFGGLLAAAVFAWKTEGSPASTSIALSAWLGRAYGIGACLWFGYAAVRDQNEQLGGVLRSKPVDGAFWVFVNWATGIALWLLLALCPFIGAAVGQAPHQGPVAFLAESVGFLRAGQVVLFAGTLSYALSRMMRSPLGGLIILLAWFCAMVGFGMIPGYLQPDYTQNGPMYLSAGAAPDRPTPGRRAAAVWSDCRRRRADLSTRPQAGADQDRLVGGNVAAASRVGQACPRLPAS